MDWDKELAATLAHLETRSQTIAVEPMVEEVGRVVRLGDGVAVVEGLERVLQYEVVLFENGTAGQVMDLDRKTIGCVLFGDTSGLEAGSAVRHTGSPPLFPVGSELLGRVVDALGHPKDGHDAPSADNRWALERDAPGPLQRQPVREPLLTGLKAVDAVIPIGRGQRELILGDRETGKTSIALDAIINQRDTGVRCIYVSIGHKRSSVVEVIDELKRHHAVDYTTVIVADASEPAALRYLAPYAGATLAEWFAVRGQHALVIYDDLTRHAEAYRDLSLILRHPPGREAYPGDIFSVHARLLERAFKLNDRLGGGSVTALPIVETQRGNMTAFIPTNLISITDGQLYLDAGLFARGQLPAIDVGKSVSRVGRDAQPGVMRDAGANLRLDLAQYEDVRDFARFGAILDDTTKRQLVRGERVTRALAQPERQVVPLVVEVVELWALKEGLLDILEPNQIASFEDRLKATVDRVAHLDVKSSASIDVALAKEFHDWVDAVLVNLVGTGPHP